MLPAVQRATTPTMAAQTTPGYPGGTLVPPGVVPGAHEGHPIGPDGAAEWNVTGNLKDWDVTAALGQLDLPVLVTSGRHDEMTPALVGPLVDGIRGPSGSSSRTAPTWPWSRSRIGTVRCSGHGLVAWTPPGRDPSSAPWCVVGPRPVHWVVRNRVATRPTALAHQPVRRSRVGRRGRCRRACGRGHRPVR
jgi:pimeloyl-ACP methyl ester carboxylesterase